MSGQLKLFAEAGKFLERVQSFLLQHEAEHCLTLGLLAGLRAGEQWGSNPPLMASVDSEGDKIKAVLLMTPPHNLIISHTDDSTIEVIARELHAMGVELPGVNSSAETALKFAKTWAKLAGCSYRVAMSQQIYQLSRITDEVRPAGRLREPSRTDDELVRKWRAAFSVDAEGMDPEEAKETALRPMQKSAHLILWEVEGEPVSMAGFTGATPNGIRVAWVYTPPEHRRKGYAGACVAALSQKLLDEGRRWCFLYTDLANPTSNHIYQTIGYEPVVDTTIYSFS